MSGKWLLDPNKTTSRGGKLQVKLKNGLIKNSQIPTRIGCLHGLQKLARAWPLQYYK